MNYLKQETLKTIRIGTIQTWGGRWASVYCVVKHYPNSRDNDLSFTGVVGPLPSGNALGGCGQIDMEFAHSNPDHDDLRYRDALVKPGDIHFAKGWNADLWLKFLELWHDYHMKSILTAPVEALEFIHNLPDADQTPAWT